MYHFRTNMSVIGSMNDDFSETEVKNEPMLFSCDLPSAWELGGPITRNFLTNLPDYAKEAADFIVDTRVHMLMPGWFPCIPGWHHDDVPRTAPNGQPNYDDIEAPISCHIMALVNGDVAPTEFAVGHIDLPQVTEGNVYAAWHEIIEEKLSRPWETIRRVSAPSNQLIYFTANDLHRGTAAVRNGWRWFGRASWNTTRKPVNEVRRQVQMYIPLEKLGW